MKEQNPLYYENVKSSCKFNLSIKVGQIKDEGLGQSKP